MTALEDMRRAAETLGTELPAGVERGFVRYLPVLEKWSKRVRLVGRPSADLVAVRHFADSLTLLPVVNWLEPGSTVLDIGSGAGFPGIPIALCRDDLRVVLLETDGRKAAFLVSAAAAVEAANVRVIAARACGDPDGEGVPRADLVVSRALMEPKRWVDLGRHYLRPGGRLVAMMGGNAPDEDDLRNIGERRGLPLEWLWRGSIGRDEKRVVASWRAEARPQPPSAEN